MIAVTLDGHLGEKYGRDWMLEIETPVDCLRLFIAQYPEFRKDLEDSELAGIGYRVVTVDEAGLPIEGLQWNIQGDRLLILPVAQGSGGIGRILAGVALVAVSLAVPAAAVGLTSMTTVGLMGGALILGGISQLLAPKSKSKKKEKDSSSSIGQALSVGSQGKPVPLLYGGPFYFDGLLPLSSGLTVNEFNAPRPAAFSASAPPATEGGALTTPDYYTSGAGGGGGKGGGGSRQPKEEANSLRSKSYAKILFLLGEGPIEGFGSEPLKNIFFDETPIQAQDGTYNYKEVAVDWRYGLNQQSSILGFAETEAETNVGVKVRASGGAIVRTITDSNADRATIRLSVPAFQVVDTKTGDVKGTSVQFRISMSINGGAAFTYLDASIDGKTSGAYERSYTIDLPKPATFWTISVTRLTPDATETTVSDELYWQSIKTSIDAPFTYPNSALLGIRLNSEQFSSIPNVGVKLYGLKIRVPDNYDPATRAYSGFWTGGFKLAWSDNPAWILYDLMLSDRYGFGRFINAGLIDKASLYTIAQYCDQLVPNGFGGLEPRFTCTARIDSDYDAKTLIDNIASTFRGMVYYAEGTIYATQDSPAVAARHYGPENVIEERDDSGQLTRPRFSYSGSGVKSRHTIALVTYYDKDDFNKPKVEPVIDEEGIRLYGYRPISIDGFGLTTRGGAHRSGEWLLYTEKNETETISFAAGAEGYLNRPGDVLDVSNPTRSGVPRSGRVLAVSGSAITLDKTPARLNLQGADNLLLINPSTYRANQFAITGVTANSAGQAVATVANLTITPVIYTPWVIQGSDILPEQWRVLSVLEKDPGEYGINGVKYDPTKWANVEYNLKLTPIKVSILGDISAAPTPPPSISVTEQLYVSRASGVRSKVNVSWGASKSSGIQDYRVEYRLASSSGAFEVLSTTSDLAAAWQDAPPGRYLFRVQAINILGLRSNYTQTEVELFGKTTPPADVTNLSISAANGNAQLVWSKTPDPDVKDGGWYIVRFTPRRQDVRWTDGFQVAQVAGAANFATAVLQSGTYMVKAYDSSGVESINFASVSSATLAIQELNTVAVIREQAVFAGVKTNMIAAGGVLQLAPDPASPNAPILFDSGTALFDARDGLFDGSIGIPNLLSGSYYFANSIDLGQVYNSRIVPNISTVIDNRQALFDSYTGLFDDYSGLFDNSNPADVSVRFQARFSDDAVTYTSWADLAIGDYSFRAVEFRLLVVSANEYTNALIDTLEVSVDMPDRLESGDAITGARVSYKVPFRLPPDVDYSPISSQPGDRFEKIDETTEGFRVMAYNNGQFVTRSFTWIARGFGEQK